LHIAAQLLKRFINFIDTIYFYILSVNLNKDFVLTSKTDKFLQFLSEADSRNGKAEEDRRLISFAFVHPYKNFAYMVNNLQATKKTFFFWQKPDENYTILGIDNLYSVQSYDKKRTEVSKNEIEKWVNNHFNNFDEYKLKSAPLFMGGMKFSPEGNSPNTIWTDYADSDWFIPKIILLKLNQQVYVIHNFIKENQTNKELLDTLLEHENIIDNLGRDTTESTHETIEESSLNNKEEKEEWIAKVDSALKQIAEGAYKKVVLSRRIKLKLSGEPNLYDKLKNLANNYPRCYIFAYAKNESIFFGASPEKLAKISDGWVEADALAGSTPRGKDRAEDEKLAGELLRSSKNLNEQNAVVEFITNSFSSFTEQIFFDEKPKIRKLSNIQHLWTPIKAKLKPGNTIFSILKEIHPTPAICGVPWTSALDFIRATEGYNRGLYAGIIGWFNFEQQGEFAVSIRSALLKNTELYAFAGCGIVEGSDPEQEFEETELKLKPILSLFDNEKIY
jgi:menaquinone-specific isochorismate synthase